MRKWKYVIGIILFLGVIWVCQKAGTYMLESIETKADATSEDVLETNELSVVIDPGHGSSDPGKVGTNDILEKDINLKIAGKLKELLIAEKIDVVMTREDDSGMADSKVEDLKARVSLINEKKPDLAVSIHQNSYQTSEVKGAQVFYFTHSTEGESAAGILQETLREIDPENHRQAKANTSYYLLKKTEVPLVIVECGFLSNPEEAGKLNTDEYQEQMAEAICKGVKRYLGR